VFKAVFKELFLLPDTEVVLKEELRQRKGLDRISGQLCYGNLGTVS
jgi:hypothetical protein